MRSRISKASWSWTIVLAASASTAILEAARNPPSALLACSAAVSVAAACALVCKLRARRSGSPGEVPGPQAPPPPARALRPRTTEGPRVLLAEDNAVNRLVATALLKRLGCSHAIAGNGIEAVEALETERFDLVLMDCQMPRMDGYEATRNIRLREAQLGRERTPVVALTANAMKGDRDLCLESGMDDYLPKPVSLDDLRRVLDRWIPAGGP